MREIVWIHGDDLSPLSPALMSAPNAPAIFVFDEDLIRDYRLRFKRLYPASLHNDWMQNYPGTISLDEKAFQVKAEELKAQL